MKSVIHTKTLIDARNDMLRDAIRDCCNEQRIAITGGRADEKSESTIPRRPDFTREMARIKAIDDFLESLGITVPPVRLEDLG